MIVAGGVGVPDPALSRSPARRIPHFTPVGQENTKELRTAR